MFLRITGAAAVLTEKSVRPLRAGATSSAKAMGKT